MNIPEKRILPMTGQGQPAQEQTEKTDFHAGKDSLAKGDLAQAALFFHNALLAAEEAGDQAAVANAAHMLGEVCMLRGDHGTAVGHYERSRDLCAKLEDMFSALSVEKKMVTALWHAKQFDKAISHSLHLLDTYQDHNNPGSAVAVLENLSEIYREKGDIGAAARALWTAAEIHAGFGHANHAAELRRKATVLAE